MLPLIIVVTVGHHSNFIGRIFACTVRTPMDTNFHDEAKCGRKDRLRPVLQSGECLYCSYSRSASLFLPLRGAHQIRMGQVLTYPLTRKEGMCYRALHNGRCLFFFFFASARVCAKPNIAAGLPGLDANTTRRPQFNSARRFFSHSLVTFHYTTTSRRGSLRLGRRFERKRQLGASM